MSTSRRLAVVALFGLIGWVGGSSWLAAEGTNTGAEKTKYREITVYQQDFEKYPVGERKIENVNGYPEDAPPDVAVTDQAYRTGKRALKVTLHPELKKDHSLSFTPRFAIAGNNPVNISLRVKLQDIKGGQPWQTPLIRANFYDKDNKLAGYVDLLISVRTTEAPADDNWVTINREIAPEPNAVSGILVMSIYDGHDVGGAVYLDDIKITNKTVVDTSFIWQIGAGGQGFLPFQTYDFAENPVIKASPNFDLATHTFTFRIPEEGGLVTNAVPGGIGAIESTLHFNSYIPITIILKWKEAEAGLRQLEIESGFYRKMFYERGDLRAEFPNGQVKCWDFVKSYYDQSKTAWQNVGPITISAVFEVKPGENFVRLDLRSAKRGDNIVFKTIKLVKAKEAKPLPPVLEFSTGKLGNVFDISEKVALQAKIYNCQPNQKSSFSYNIRNYFNQVVAEETVNFTADQSGKAAVEFFPLIKGTGYFLLTPKIAGKETYVFDFVRVLKAGEKDKVDYAKSPFGVNLAQLGYGLRNPELYEKSVILARQAGATWSRMNSICWRWMEPEKGKYNWEPWDTQIDIQCKHGLKILGTFYSTPDWARKYPKAQFSANAFCEAPIPADYADFVGKAVSRYKDRVKYWEIWNEAFSNDLSPYWYYWGGNTEEYADILKAAYPVIKKIDPEATVLCTSDSGKGVAPFLPKVVERAGLNSFDINNIHYSPLTYQGVKDLFENWRRQGVDKPAWNTEAFSFIPPLFTPENSNQKAAGMWKIIISNWAGGLGKTFYWCADIDCLNDVDLHATVFYPAYRTLTHRLEGAEYVNNILSLGEGIEGYIFNNRGETLVVLFDAVYPWNNNSPRKISLDTGVPRVKIIDIMDNESDVPTENGILRIPVGSVPFIVKGANSETILLNTVLRSGPKNSFIMAGETGGFEVTLRNIYRKADMKGVLSFENVPPGWIMEPKEIPFTIKGPSELKVPVKITPAKDAGHKIYTLTVCAKLDDAKKTILSDLLGVGVVDTPFGVNLLSNPGFEEGENDPPAGWWYGQLNPDVKFSRVTNEAHTGRYSVKFEAAQKKSGGSILAPTSGSPISVLPGEAYVLSNWCKGDPEMRCLLHLREYDRNGKYASTNTGLFYYHPVGGNWKRTAAAYVVPKDIYSISLGFVFENIQGTIYLDDFSFSRFRGKPIMSKFLYELRSPKAAAPLLIDGDGQKWQGIEKTVLDDIGSVRKAGATEAVAGDVPFDWRGKDDLSVEFATQWDESNLYLRVKVKDDVFVQPFANIERYKGDSIQIGLDPNNASDPGGGDYCELMLSTNPEGKLEVLQTHNMPDMFMLPDMHLGLMKNWKVVVKRDEAKKETSYEAAIPFLVFGPGFKPESGKNIGFSLLVNDNDGQGRRGWMEWSSGIGKDKEPRLYGSLTFK